MPTVRPRHQITETPDVAHALDLAARRWPDEPHSKLLLRLIDAGRATLEQDRRVHEGERLTAVQASHGKYAEAFGAGYLASLRREWPE